MKRIFYRDNWPENKYLPGQKTAINIVPGLELEKVENHCSSVLYKNLPRILESNKPTTYDHSLDVTARQFPRKKANWSDSLLIRVPNCPGKRIHNPFVSLIIETLFKENYSCSSPCLIRVKKETQSKQLTHETFIHIWNERNWCTPIFSIIISKINKLLHNFMFVIFRRYFLGLEHLKIKDMIRFSSQ